MRSRTALFVSLAFLIYPFFPQRAHAQQTYLLKATPKTVAWGYFDAKAAPVLCIKSGDTVEIQTPAASVPAQEEKRPVVYVKHAEMPFYPPLALQTRVGATVVMNLKIAADGRVQGVESSSSESVVPKMLEFFVHAAENTIKTWTFGCAGCPLNAPFEHTIKFNYKPDIALTPHEYRIVMNLPDELTISIGADTINTSKSVQTPKKGTN